MFITNVKSNLKGIQTKILSVANKSRVFKTCLSLSFILSFASNQVLAAEVDQIDTFMNLIAGYVQKGGFIVIFIGGIMAALGWRNDEPSEMIRGIKTLISGALVAALATGYRTWA